MSTALPATLTPDDIKIRIVSEIRNPNVRNVYSVTLKDGPRTFRFATVFEIVDGKGEHHHFCLRLDTYGRTKAGWAEKPERSVVLESGYPDEIAILVKFLRPVVDRGLPSSSGEYHLVDGDKFANLPELLSLVRGADSIHRFKLLQAIVASTEPDTLSGSEWLRVFETGGSTVLQTVSAAARLIEYQRALDELVCLINGESASEGEFQRLLAANPWMFGSEYSELIPRRNWTRDDRLDYMLRRTVDAYLEIVEIKTAFRKPLFRYDQSHDSYASSAELSTVLGQVVRYIEEVDRNRDSIIVHDGLDSLKVRARVVVGRDGSPEQQHALRNLNGHLHRIEVITFDQLRRIADRVLGVFAATVATPDAAPAFAPDDDLPF
jgi:hypothetical protein